MLVYLQHVKCSISLIICNTSHHLNYHFPSPQLHAHLLSPSTSTKLLLCTSATVGNSENCKRLQHGLMYNAMLCQIARVFNNSQGTPEQFRNLQESSARFAVQGNLCQISMVLNNLQGTPDVNNISSASALSDHMHVAEHRDACCLKRRFTRCTASSDEHAGF